MHLPRQQISQLYTQLSRSTHPSSAPVLVLTSLTVDSLCATRILTSLLKRDFIPHTIIPVSGYSDLQQVGSELVLPLTRQRGGDGGTAICLGLGGVIALEEALGLEGPAEEGNDAHEEMRDHGVEIWVIDAHRPWHLQNVFGSSNAEVETQGVVPLKRPGIKNGRLLSSYKPGRGGVIVWDDGNLEAELQAEREAYFELQGMPDITEDDLTLGDGGSEDEEEDGNNSRDERPSSSSQKRKRADSLEDSEVDSEDDESNDRPERRRRSNSSTSIPILSSPGGNPLSAQWNTGSTPPTMPSSPPLNAAPSARQRRRDLLKLRRKHEATLDNYYDRGSKNAEPVSSILYSLASELGREDNELLWLAIVGISSASISPAGLGSRASELQEVLQDEVRRLNPIPERELQRSQSSEGVIPTTARSSTDTNIRLSPEPRFLLIRHWSLYDSMLHSPFLATRLHVWSDNGRKRLHKLLAKMGISLQEAGKGYLHMDSELKRTLRQRILKFAEQYNLDGLVPGDNGRRGMEGWGFVRSWGWRGTLSAEDVAVVVAAMLEIGSEPGSGLHMPQHTHGSSANYNTRMQNLPTPPHSSDDDRESDGAPSNVPDYVTKRFFKAYDALAPSSGLNTLLQNLPVAQTLYKAILRVGSALISKRQLRHLSAFRMGVVKEGPDVPLFVHPGALVRLAAWLSEAVAVLESESGARRKKNDEALVVAALDEGRGVYVVVGLDGRNGWGRNGRRIRSKAEIKEREEKRKRKAADRAAKKADRKRQSQERRQLRKERNAANGILDSDDEDDDTESEGESESASSDDSDNDSGSDDDVGPRHRSLGLNRFGQAFQEVVEETGARVRIDSFEHSVVEVKKEDLGGFLEALTLKRVVE